MLSPIIYARCVLCFAGCWEPLVADSRGPMTLTGSTRALIQPAGLLFRSAKRLVRVAWPQAGRYTEVRGFVLPTGILPCGGDIGRSRLGTPICTCLGILCITKIANRLQMGLSSSCTQYLGTRVSRRQGNRKWEISIM